MTELVTPPPAPDGGTLTIPSGAGTLPAPVALPEATPPAAAPQSDPEGFPPGTAVKDMTPEQQTAYWKTQARKHESRHLDALGLKSLEELAQLRKAAQEIDELRRSQMTEHELAIAAARDSATESTRREYGGRLVAAEFRAASAGRVTTDVLAELRIDPAAYLSADGEPDTAAIAAAVARLAPQQDPAPPGPLNTGGGVGGGPGPSLQQQIAAAEAAGQWPQAAHLKTLLLSQQPH